MQCRLSIATPCTFSVSILLLLLNGCIGSPHKSNPPPPNAPSTPASSFSVMSIVPAQGATGVATNTTIQITFSEAANPATVNTTDITVTNPEPASGAVSYNPVNNTATFTPSAALVPNSTYTVMVSGVTSSGGAAMAGPFKSEFATAASSSSTLQYQATLLANALGATSSGQVSMDTSGKTTVQISGASPNTTYSVQFCPAFLAGSNGPNCFTIGSLSTNASGNGTATIQFPKPGSWAGDFELFSGTTASGTNPDYETDVEPQQFVRVPLVFMATMQPVNTVNGGALMALGLSLTQSPLTSGTVTYSNGSLLFSLTGALPNTSYVSGEDNIAIGSSSSYQLGNSQGQSAFQTDDKGDVTFTVLQDGVPGDMFLVQLPQNNQAGYIGGFSVP